MNYGTTGIQRTRQSFFEPRDDETAFEAATELHQLLHEASNDDSKLRALIDGLGDNDELPVHEATGKPMTMPSYAIQKLLKHKKILCLFMARALKIALVVDGLQGSVHWQNTCGEAVSQFNKLGLFTYTSETGKAIRDWFIIFRKRRKFPNPLFEINRHGPLFLLAHPDTVKRFKEKADNNLESLTCDYMHDWVHTIELPRILKAHNDKAATAEERMTMEEYLSQYHLSKLCRSTVHNWLLHCGFE